MSLSWHELCVCEVPEDPLLCVIGLILVILLHLLLCSDLTAQVGRLPKCLKVKKKKVCHYITSIYLSIHPAVYSLFIFFSPLPKDLLWYTRGAMADNYLDLMNRLSRTFGQWDKVVTQNSVEPATEANQESTKVGQCFRSQMEDWNKQGSKVRGRRLLYTVLDRFIFQVWICPAVISHTLLLDPHSALIKAQQKRLNMV